MLRLLMHATDCCQVWGILKHATNGCQAWNNFTPFTFVPAKFTDVRCLMKNAINIHGVHASPPGTAVVILGLPGSV